MTKLLLILVLLFAGCKGIKKNYGFTMPTHPPSMPTKYVVLDEQDASHLLLFLQGKYDLADDELTDIKLALVQSLGTPLEKGGRFDVK